MHLYFSHGMINTSDARDAQACGQSASAEATETTQGWKCILRSIAMCTVRVERSTFSGQGRYKVRCCQRTLGGEVLLHPIVIGRPSLLACPYRRSQSSRTTSKRKTFLDILVSQRTATNLLTIRNPSRHTRIELDSKLRRIF